MLFSVWWLAIATICLYICWNDFRARIIKNQTITLLLVLLIPLGFASDKSFYFYQALITFSVGFLLWKLAVFGAGDVKLASIFALFIEPSYSALVLFIMLVIGGIEALMYLATKALKPELIKLHGIPFSIPIVISGLFGLGASI